MEKSQTLVKPSRGNIAAVLLKYQRPLKYILVTLFSLVIIALVYLFFFYNQATVKNFDHLTRETAINQDIQIYYNKRVTHAAKIGVYPAEAVETVWKDGLNSTTLTVHPKNKWKLSTKYEVDTTGAKSVYSQEMPPALASFTTQKSPMVTSSSPKNEETSVAVDTKLQLSLDSPNSGVIDPEIIFFPASKIQSKVVS